MVKKLIAIAAVVAAVLTVRKKIAAQQAERELWAEATGNVTTN